MTVFNATTTGSYLAKGEPDPAAGGTYIVDYYAYDMVPLGGDRFVVFFYADDTYQTTFGGFIQSYQIISATVAGWTAVTERLPLPTDANIWRIGARDYGVMVAPNRVLLQVRRNLSVALLDFTGDVCTVVTSATIPGRLGFNRRPWLMADGTVVIHEYDGGFGGGRLTAFSISGDAVTVGASVTITFPDELDSPNSGIEPMVIGNRLLFMGSTQETDPVYADDPDFPDPYKPKRRVPYWRVFDVPTMTFIGDYFPISEALRNTNNGIGGIGVALSSTQAFVSMPLAHGWDGHLSPTPPAGYLGDQGWIATVTLDSAGALTFQQHDGTQWPTRVEAVAMGPLWNAAPSPWADPRRLAIDTPKNLYVGSAALDVLPSGLLAYSLGYHYDNTDDNEIRVFFWDPNTSTVAGWAALKTGRGNAGGEGIRITIGNADDRLHRHVLSDGTLLHCLDEQYEPDPDGRGMYSESVWLATAAFTDAPIPTIGPNLAAELKDIGQSWGGSPW